MQQLREKETTAVIKQLSTFLMALSASVLLAQAPETIPKPPQSRATGRHPRTTTSVAQSTSSEGGGHAQTTDDRKTSGLASSWNGRGAEGAGARSVRRQVELLGTVRAFVDQEWNWRENQALSRRLKNAKLRTPNACVEEIDYRTARGLDKSVIRS